MTKDEMIAYGIAPEKVKEFSRQYHREMRELADKSLENRINKKDVPNLRAAILALVPTLKNADSLRHVLKAVNRASYAEECDRKADAEMRAAIKAAKTAQEPVTVDDLTEEVQEGKEDAQ